MSRSPRGPQGRLRIVGGEYRGRTLTVPNHRGLRPTSDRVRETLFNWLSPVIEGARCVDLFAGSGALGFEAVSRGAAEVVMVERVEAVTRVLRAHAGALGTGRVTVVHADALRWLAAEGRPFDIAFLDPPFADDLLARSFGLLATGRWLSPGARVYLEAPVSTGFPTLPSDWHLVRDKRAGRVRYGLAETGAKLGESDRAASVMLRTS